MKPVIPKVRVGDVLLGTRSLRRWLQTASILNYLDHVVAGGTGYAQDRKAYPYSPARSDSYVVCVNAWESFGVWANRPQGALLLWRNHTKSCYDYLSCPTPYVRMGPAHFSRWFIRTSNRLPAIEAWPEYAYYIWACLQQNGYTLGLDHVNISNSSHLNHQSPFLLPHTIPKIGRDHIHHAVRTANLRGLTRGYSGRTIPTRPHGFGPEVENIEFMEAQIHALRRDPRIIKDTKNDKQKISELIDKLFAAVG